MDERNDPEACFRRGFVHGTEEVYRAVSPVLPPSLAAELRHWLDNEVARWRVLNLKEEHSSRQAAPRFNMKSN